MQAQYFKICNNAIAFMSFNILQVVPEEKVTALCESIVRSGTEYSKRVNSPCPLMYSYYHTEYLGMKSNKQLLFSKICIFEHVY